MESSAAVQIYRILQEALNNVARHSGAKQAWVRLRFLPSVLELEVEDHGAGFNGQPAKQGIGLVAMRERSELMEGALPFPLPLMGDGGAREGAARESRVSGEGCELILN